MTKAFPGSFLLAPSRFGDRRRSQEVTAVWLNPARNRARPFSSVFILALTPNCALRETLESDLAGVAASRRLKATRSIDLYPTALRLGDRSERQLLWDRIKGTGCDAIYTLSLLSVKCDQRYMPGNGPYAPYPQHSYYNQLDAYCEHVDPIVSTPDYYKMDKTYFLEGNVFLTATGEIQWSMQSIAYNPVDLECFSKEYALLLIDELNKTMEL